MILRAKLASFERAKRLYFNTVPFDEKEARRLVGVGAHAFIVKAVRPYMPEEMDDERQRVVKIFAEMPPLSALVETRPEDYRGLEGIPMPNARPGGRYTSFGRFVVPAEVPGLYEALNEENELAAVYHVLGLVFSLLKDCRPTRRWRDDIFATTRTVLARKRNSCASWANLPVSFLRSLRIPARLAYGAVKRLGNWSSHAWVEVEFRGRLVSFDPMNARGGYSVGADCIKLFTCADWGDVDFSGYRAFLAKTGWWPPFEVKPLRE